MTDSADKQKGRTSLEPLAERRPADYARLSTKETKTHPAEPFAYWLMGLPYQGNDAVELLLRRGMTFCEANQYLASLVFAAMEQRREAA